MQGPSSAKGTGRVEVLYKGQWGTICDNNWDINDARVICRQLGYKYGVKALLGDDVPDGTGKIWLDKVACTGSELILSSCSHGGLESRSCGHSKDAGVECSSAGNHYKYCFQNQTRARVPIKPVFHYAEFWA